MTSKEKVRKVYPEATWTSLSVAFSTPKVGANSVRYVIWSKHPQYLGAVQLGEAPNRASWAWADAARKLKEKGAKG